MFILISTRSCNLNKRCSSFIYYFYRRLHTLLDRYDESEISFNHAADSFYCTFSITTTTISSSSASFVSLSPSDRSRLRRYACASYCKHLNERALCRWKYGLSPVSSINKEEYQRYMVLMLLCGRMRD